MFPVSDVIPSRTTPFVTVGLIGGATPLWEWIGDEPATVFSY